MHGFTSFLNGKRKGLQSSNDVQEHKNNIETEMKGYLKLLLLNVCLCEKGVICKDVITKISTRTSIIPGSGMDSDISFLGLDTGGGFEMRLCGGETRFCCQTGELNTEDDNWELGQVDWAA